MLETLKHGEGRRMPMSANVPAAPAPGADCVVEWEIGAEVPYVEVGGPNKKVELSPSLMMHPAQSSQPPHVKSEPPIPGVKAKIVQLTPAQPMSVAFETWPASNSNAAISSEVVAFHQPANPASLEYAKLLDAMLMANPTGAPRVVLALGLRSSVGVSTVLANLAVIAAQMKKLRVVVLDVNHDAGLVRRLGCGASHGLGDVLKGAVALEQGLTRTLLPTLHALSAGKSADALTDSAIRWLIACLRNRYDLILIDGPNLNAANEITLLIPHADDVYLVLPQGEAPTLGKTAAQTVARAGGRLSGLIHTHFE
jgi:Mrp family chromosome partitioning ATPase